LVESFLSIFNNFKTILCLCPHCNYIMRLSDLHLRSKSPAPITWLDTYELKENKTLQKEEKLKQDKKKIQAVETAKGQVAVKKIIKNSLEPKFKKLNFNPYDVKVLNHPIDFVVFDGDHDGDVRNVTLLTYRDTNPNLQKLHKGIESAIQQKDYDWKLLRISREGQANYE